MTTSDLRSAAPAVDGPLTEAERQFAENLELSSCLSEEFLQECVRARLCDLEAADRVVALSMTQHVDA